MRKILILFLFLAFPSVAQETSATGSSADKPEMPILFFTKEQRRVLEAVRRGVVQKEDLEIESGEFVPVVLLEETIGNEVEQRQTRRGKEIKVNALIRNHSTGRVLRSKWGKSLMLTGKLMRACRLY